MIDFLPILDAQRQLLFAQDELAQSDQALSTNLVALYKAIGGGWEFETHPAQPPEEQSQQSSGAASIPALKGEDLTSAAQKARE